MNATQTQQPEALRLARWLEHRSMSGVKPNDLAASTELRRLYARIEELEEHLAATPAADVSVVPQGWKPVQIELLERIQESLGSFLSDQGWSQSDMDTADALGELLSAAPQPPAAAPAQPGWCDGCSPDNCVGCGPTSDAQVQPEPNKGSSHETC